LRKPVNLAFPHHIVHSPARRRATERCPGCGWGVFDGEWQYTEDGQRICRRCGYSSKMGRRRSLPNRSKVLTPQEAAERLQLSRRTVYTWILQGWLRGHRIGGRWFVTLPDLEQFRKLTTGATGRPMPQLWQQELKDLWAKVG
jgi:excisionase family DNA binding protein